MKATVLQQNLNKALAMTGRLITGRGQLPVLSNVLVEAKKEELVLCSTNLEMGLRVVAGGKVETEGAITVPAKSLAEFVGSMGEGNVELATEGEKLKVSCGRLAAVFAGIAASEFPVIPAAGAGEKDSRKIKIKKGMVDEIAGQVAFAAAGDESRPVLTGVMFKTDGDELCVTATDGFRLSRKKFSAGGEATGWKEGLILPARTLLELARIGGESKKEEVVMEMVNENNQVIFDYGQVQLVSRILEGNFPDVERIIPKEFKTEIIVDKEELVRAVRAVSIFARENNNIMRLETGSESWKLSAAASQTGEGETTLEADIKGEGGVIAFNYRYIADFLGSIAGERVVFKMNEGVDPGVWGQEGQDDFLHIIMPVRI